MEGWLRDPDPIMIRCNDGLKFESHCDKLGVKQVVTLEHHTTNVPEIRAPRLHSEVHASLLCRHRPAKLLCMQVIRSLCTPRCAYQIPQDVDLKMRLVVNKQDVDLTFTRPSVDNEEISER